MKRSYFKSGLLLVLLGVGLGNLARLILGAPDDGSEFPRRFQRPIPADFQPVDKDESPNLLLSQPTADENTLIPPLGITYPVKPKTDPFGWEDHSLESDELAIFEPHGDKVCASGCALSRHPTSHLSEDRFRNLLLDYSVQPLSHDSSALEELLFYGPQSQTYLDRMGCGLLDAQRANFLRKELTRTHASISIRVIEKDGTRRSWLPPTKVPFDRRHVFEMKTNALQPLVTSGTIKRVGLNHVWARL